jgi:hypothetical protein
VPETRALSVRVPVDLLEWADGYAAARGSTRSAVVQAALREFRELANSGVPDLPELAARDGRSAGVGRVRGAGSRASSSPGAPVASRPAAGAPAEGSSAELAARAGRDAHAGLADVVTGTGPRPSVRAVPEAVRARQERLNRAKGMR